MYSFKGAVLNAFSVPLLPNIRNKCFCIPGITNSYFGILRKPWKGKGMHKVLKAGNLFIILSGLVNLMFQRDRQKDSIFRRSSMK